MVNVIIYLKQELDASEIVKFLLAEKLIAAASIDNDNNSYKIIDGAYAHVVYNVITAQSKAVLFNEIVKAVEEKAGSDVLINSIPIVGSNDTFYRLVKANTLDV